MIRDILMKIYKRKHIKMVFNELTDEEREEVHNTSVYTHRVADTKSDMYSRVEYTPQYDKKGKVIGEEPIGYVEVFKLGCGYGFTIAVVKKWRRHGYGRLLFKSMIEFLEQDDEDRYLLQGVVNKSNLGGQEFLKEMGFINAVFGEKMPDYKNEVFHYHYELAK